MTYEAKVRAPAANFQTLWKHENGYLYPGKDYRRAYCLLYRATESELGLRPPLPGESPHVGPRVLEVEDAYRTTRPSDEAILLWEGDMERRKLLIGSTLSIAGLRTVGNWRELGYAVGNPVGKGRKIVEMADIDAIGDVTRTFRRLDNKFGGGKGRSTVVHFLVEYVKPLLVEGKFSGEIGRGLYSASAELMHLAGWMAYDLNLHGLAQKYLMHALEFASEAGDAAFSGEIIAGMSHQALYIDRPTEALALARASRDVADDSEPLLTAESYLLEAQASALLHNGKECAALLILAERSFSRSMSGGASPEWLQYLDPAYIAAQSARCLMDSGQLEQAELFAARSLEMDQSYVRGRALNMALLARIRVARKDIDGACHAGAEAVRLAGRLDSERTAHQVDGVTKSLRPYRSTAAVRDYESLIAGSSL